MMNLLLYAESRQMLARLRGEASSIVTTCPVWISAEDLSLPEDLLEDQDSDPDDTPSGAEPDLDDLFRWRFASQLTYAL